MSWAVVIDQSPSVIQEIEDNLVQLDKNIRVIPFADSHAFLEWMQKLQDHDPKIEPVPPTDKFLGLITGVETWKFRNVGLIGKMKALFVQKKLAQNEDDIFVIFTGYETPGFQKRRFEQRSVNNFIFKPFDKVVLKQSLDIALSGRAAVKNHYTHVLKSKTQIEMLKEIKISGISEVGFETISDQAIDPGTIAKYYADFLTTGQHRSALASVIKCDPAEQEGSYRIRLRFYALDQKQSFNLQRLAQKEGHIKRPLPGEPRTSDSYEFVFVRHENSTLGEEVQPSIERFYDHPVAAVKSLTELGEHFRAQAPNPHLQKCFVFIDALHIAGNEVGEVDALRALYPDRQLVIFVIAPRIYADDLENELSRHCDDIFYAPFNRSYIIKALKQRWPELKN